MPRLLHNERGLTLFTVLFALVVIGLMLGLTGQAWSDLMWREREEELYFRGDQYRRAIQSYYEKAHGGAGRYPTELKLLLEDKRFLQKVRHLRKLWNDPVTGAEWEPIPAEQQGGIKGVRSRSTRKPFKEDGFPEEYKNFAGATSYTQWEFVFEPAKPQAPPAAQTTPPATGTKTVPPASKP